MPSRFRDTLYAPFINFLAAVEWFKVLKPCILHSHAFYKSSVVSAKSYAEGGTKISICAGSCKRSEMPEKFVVELAQGSTTS